MIKKTNGENRRIEIDLTGSAGNIYYLMGCARTLAQQIGLDFEVVWDEMKSSDYVNAVMVFEKYFGETVVLHTSEQLFELIKRREQSTQSRKE